MSTMKILKTTLNATSATVATVMLIVPMLIGLEVAVFGVQQASAQEEAAKRQTKKVESIRQKHMKTFEKIQETLEEKNTAETKALLDKLAQDPDLNNIEKAYLHNFRGNICFEEDNLNCALREYKLVTATREGLSDSFYNQMLYVIAQVLFSQENYREALQYAQRWFQTQEDPPADAYMLVGQAHYMLKDFDSALPNVQQGISKYEALGSVPKENWLQLLSQIYREKDDYLKMLPVLKQLVQFYPKKTYLITMASVFNELDDQPRMTAMYQALYDQNLLTTEAEVVALAQLTMSEENPFPAAQIMEKGLASGLIKSNLKNYRIYAQALFAAKEYQKALDPLEKAAGLAADGNLYNQLGVSLMQLNRWREAESALKKAISKGKLQNTGAVLISLGLSQFEQKQFKEAEATFVRATNFESVSGSARNWIKYVKSEVVRIRELEAPIPEIDTSVEPIT